MSSGVRSGRWGERGFHDLRNLLRLEVGIASKNIRTQVVARNLASGCALDIGAALGRDAFSVLPSSDGWRSDTERRSECVLSAQDLDRAIEGRLFVFGNGRIHG